jgi:hypothetical protein
VLDLVLRLAHRLAELRRERAETIAAWARLWPSM